MSNKSVILKDMDGNTCYPKTTVSNVIGLAPIISDGRHIYYGSGAPSSDPLYFEYFIDNDIYINTSNNPGLQPIGSYYVGKLVDDTISWEMKGNYIIGFTEPPKLRSEWDIFFDNAAPYLKEGLMYCNSFTGGLYKIIDWDANSITWEHLNDEHKNAPAIINVNKGQHIELKDSSDISIKAINIYGKSIQDNTPSIDYPQEIKNVENESINFRSKNLINLSDLKKTNLTKTRCSINITDQIELTCTEDGVIAFGGWVAVGDTVSESAFSKGVVVPVNGIKRVHISSVNGVFTELVCMMLDKDLKNLEQRGGSTLSRTDLPEGTEWIYIQIKVLNATSGNIYKDNIQLELGTEQTEFEYYKTAQNANFDYILHGIPVSSGGNYTDDNNQQWVCDTIEKYADGTGKYIQRIKELSGSYIAQNAKDFSYGISNNHSIMFTVTGGSRPDWKPSDRAIRIMCTDLNPGYYSNGSQGIQFTTPSQTEAKIVISFGLNDTRFDEESERLSWLQNLTDDFKLYYILETPIETQLTAGVLAKLELNTYCPITNIISNADVEVTYVVDTKTYIDNKFEQLEQAIISMGGNI